MVRTDHGFRRTHRLRLRRDIDEVFRRGLRREGELFSFRILRKEDPTPRLLTVASRKVGGAVERNRVRRGVREGFRKNKQLFAHYDLVVIARPATGRLRPGEIARRMVEEFQEVADGPRDLAHPGGI
ncbi:MAG: ribonuclease P protein component [Candidatus Bipolaricaulaceae bacterium]